MVFILKAGKHYIKELQARQHIIVSVEDIWKTGGRLHQRNYEDRKWMYNSYLKYKSSESAPHKAVSTTDKFFHETTYMLAPFVEKKEPFMNLKTKAI